MSAGGSRRRSIGPLVLPLSGGFALHQCPFAQRPSGNTGSTSRPKVEVRSAASPVYQAAIAVMIPSHPPSLIVPFVVCVPVRLAWPIANSKNVIASTRNTSASAPVVRSDAINISTVKIVHEYRYSENPASLNEDRK